MVFFFDSQKLVVANREVLLALRTNFDKPDVMKTEFKKLQRKNRYKNINNTRYLL